MDEKIDLTLNQCWVWKTVQRVERWMLNSHHFPPQHALLLLFIHQRILVETFLSRNLYLNHSGVEKVEVPPMNHGMEPKFSERARKSDLTVGVIGLGYVGLPTAIGFHDAGFRAWGVDISQHTVDTVLKGENPTGDPDINDIVPKPGVERWHITTSTSEAVQHCDVVWSPCPPP